MGNKDKLDNCVKKPSCWQSETRRKSLTMIRLDLTSLRTTLTLGK